MSFGAKFLKFLGKIGCLIVLSIFCLVFGFAVHAVTGLSLVKCDYMFAIMITTIIALIWAVADIQREDLEKECADGEKCWRELNEKHKTLLNMIDFFKGHNLQKYLSDVGASLTQNRFEAQGRYVEVIRSAASPNKEADLIINDFKEAQKKAEFELREAESRLKEFNDLVFENGLAGLSQKLR